MFGLMLKIVLWLINLAWESPSLYKTSRSMNYDEKNEP